MRRQLRSVEGGACLLHGVQVLARHVLDQSNFKRREIVIPRHQRRNALQAREVSRTPAPLTRDELIPVVFPGTNKHRLQNTALAHRIRQLLQCPLIEVTTRLREIRLDHGNRQLSQLLG
jgi:hypothetical protein